MTHRVIPPGRTIGIIGGGQLGRMTALAAAQRGYACHIYCPEANSPAAQVAAQATVAAYDDVDALARFADAVDVVTFEFENIPHETVQILADHVLVRPRWECLHIAQDRLREKDFLTAIGVPTAPYARIESAADLGAALETLGRPAVLKTVRFGYDGKGQVKIDPGMDPADAWAQMGSDLGVLEGFIDFAREISVIIARSPDGTWAAFDPVENIHTHHILDVTRAPAAMTRAAAGSAVELARRIVEAMDLVGLLAVEMFETRDGALLVNEVAPRPHNSGHWTIDACATSQFEQFVRAVCGLPLGSPARHADAEMKNLLGDDIDGWADLLGQTDLRLHLYGKAEARPGRKMGHATRLFAKTGSD